MRLSHHLPPAGRAIARLVTMISVLIVNLILVSAHSFAGPYSEALNDPTNENDAPIPGFVGPDGDGISDFSETQSNFVNPIFFGWVTQVLDYSPAPGVALQWTNTDNLEGIVTGDNFHVVSLGDLRDPETAPVLGVDPNDLTDDLGFVGVDEPGSVTVTFDQPIVNLSGADFVVFENGFLSDFSMTGDEVFAELAYVEVSSDGNNFIRIPPLSLTSEAVGPFGAVDPSNVFNLAGKHVNEQSNSWGTPFDLEDVGVDSITHIKLIDIPGDGTFTDSSGNPIYDAWVTIGSGGADLEAIGAISQIRQYNGWPQLAELNVADRDPLDDPELDGKLNLCEYAFATLCWLPDAGVGSPVSSVVKDNGSLFAEIQFRRDERARDVTYEVEAADHPNGPWTVIARSENGNPLTAVNNSGAIITEASASEIASIGVIRKVTVRDSVTTGNTRLRFLRVRLSLADQNFTSLP